MVSPEVGSANLAMPPDFRKQLFEAIGLAHEAIGPIRQTFLHQILVSVQPRKDDDGKVRIPGFDKLEHFQAIVTAQVEIQNDEVEGVLLQLANREFDRACGGYNASFMAKVKRQHFAKRGFIINEQNVRLHSGSFTCFRRKCKCLTSRGNPIRMLFWGFGEASGLRKEWVVGVELDRAIEQGARGRVAGLQFESCLKLLSGLAVTLRFGQCDAVIKVRLDSSGSQPDSL